MGRWVDKAKGGDNGGKGVGYTLASKVTVLKKKKKKTTKIGL